LEWSAIQKAARRTDGLEGAEKKFSAARVGRE
jgi:hypothetical protein